MTPRSPFQIGPADRGGESRRGGDAGVLRAWLQRVRRRWFALALLTAAAHAAAGAAVPLAGLALAGRLIPLSSGAVIALAATVAVLATAAAVLAVLRMPRRPDDRQVARFIEERTADVPEWRDSGADALVSAVQVANTPETERGAFGNLILARAAASLRVSDPSAVVSGASVRRAAARAGAGLAALGLALAAAAPFLLRAGGEAFLTLFPGRIEIAVHPGDARLAAGRPLRITAALRGPGVRFLPVAPSLVVSSGAEERAVPMDSESAGFSHTFERVDRSFHYQVTAGGARSERYAVTALHPPRVTRIDVQYEYPAFTGLAPRLEEDGGDVYGPAGTRVRLLVHTDRPLARGALALASGGRIPLTPGSGTVASADMVLARDDGYRVRATDAEGMQAAGDVEYFVRVMDDRPPTVRITRPSADTGISPLEEVLVEARADDDYGVARLELVYTVAGRQPHVVPFTEVTGTAVARAGSRLLAAEELGVQPGDVIAYHARARDVARGRRSVEARSDIFFLEVRPFNEEFTEARSQAGSGGSTGSQIDGAIAAQKEIITATWNLERRSGAGRSSDDLEAVREAQAQLKARVERMLTGGRPGMRGQYPPQQVAPPARGRRPGVADPIRAAVGAMARAVDELQKEQAAAAIPYEMAALQALLQAQAEVRRREVMRQAANAGGQGGTSRSDRDLSALFDRELQRQQRTNYEAPSGSAEAPERREPGDALDRVRELARRQEELARRQRELAESRVAAEELRRQLERLAREQEALQQQAGRLERELGEQAGDGSPAPRGGSGRRQGREGAGASRDLSRASEQMRSATESLKRQQAAGAAESAQKAAAALRDLERQVRGRDSGAHAREAGDLRLEAQQIAEGQRRAAAELSRLEKSGGAPASQDALRRLAAEKEKLADRVEELGRTARRLRPDAPAGTGDGLERAAREIQQQRIAERMRESAAALRDRAPAPGSAGRGRQNDPAPRSGRAETEQQLARAIESIVEALGGGGDDLRRLSGELDRTRAMRDELDRLERQVREAEANARGSRSPAEAQQSLQRARDAYARELQRTRAELGRLGNSRARGLDGATPEQHEYSRSAPGNEAFKQDFSSWEALRREIDLAVEQYEAAVAAQLARKIAEDRLTTGGSDRVPERYRSGVARYFESLARGKR